MDLYKILELEPNCSISDIKKNYYRLAKQYHPDKNKLPEATKKFQEINYAYNILIDDNNRQQYNKMNSKDDFHSFLEKIFNGKKVNWTNEFKNFGININVNKLNESLNTFLEKLNFLEIINLYTQNILPKKNNDYLQCSDSDVNSWDETQCEYYQINDLPIMYQRYNKKNINLELNISIDDIKNNNIRKLQIVRKINDKDIKCKFQFKIQSPYIIYHYGGDISDIDSGHLIIKLNLPDKFEWGYNYIMYNIDINLFNYMYGIKLKLTFINTQLDISNWIPYRDGNLMLLSNKINTYDIGLKFNLIYNHSDDKKQILYKYFK